jgi:hypothetical protein
MASKLELLKALVANLRRDESKIKEKITLYESEIKKLEHK